MLDDKLFIFIIGCPRSGTTWLQAMLGQNPKVCTLSELKLFDFYTASWIKAWRDQMEIQKRGNLTGLPIVWTEDDFYEFLREFLRKIYTLVLKTKPGASVIIDKTPAYALYVEDINRLVPNCRFIHVLRDGRDVGLSLRAASKGWGNGWAPDDIEAAGQMWKKMVLGAKSAEKFRGRYLEIQYEEILSNGPKALKDVYDFIGIPTDIQELEKLIHDNTIEKMRQKQGEGKTLYRANDFFRKGSSGQWRDAMTPTDRYRFDKVSGDLLRELGYANEDWWIAHWYERYAVPLRIFVSTKRRHLRSVARAMRTLISVG